MISVDWETICVIGLCMKIIKLLLLDDPDGYLSQLLPLHKALLKASERTNNLRQYAISSLMVKQIFQAKDMLVRSRSERYYYCYRDDPFVYSVEDTDKISDIFELRDSYVHNVPMA